MHQVYPIQTASEHSYTIYKLSNVKLVDDFVEINDNLRRLGEKRKTNHLCFPAL